MRRLVSLFGVAALVAAAGSFAVAPVSASGLVPATGSGNFLSVSSSPGQGHSLTRVEFYWADGYNKIVTIPGHNHVTDINISDCLHGPLGTNDPCHPRLSNVDRETALAGTTTGEGIGHHQATIRETATGSGVDMSVGHRNHGALVRIDLKWANGFTEFVKLPGLNRVTDVDLHPGTPAHLSTTDHD